MARKSVVKSVMARMKSDTGELYLVKEGQEGRAEQAVSLTIDNEFVLLVLELS